MSVVERVPTTARGSRHRPGGRWTIILAVAMAGLGLVLLAPLAAPYDPFARVGRALQPPSWRHLCGTDEIGRDLFSRILYGVRLTLLPGLGIILAGLSIGTILGGVAGAIGGLADRAVQRLTDLFQILPSTILALAVVATLGPGIRNTMIAVTLNWWPWYCRLARTELRVVALSSHVEAARQAGARPLRLFWRYMLPSAIPTLLVMATLDVANVILVLAFFSFLGLGAPAPAPELGAIAARAIDSLADFWWLPLMPSLAIFLLAFLANLGGDALRAALDDF